MKNKIISLIILSSLFIVTFAGKKISEPEVPSLTGTITISGAFALYPMAVRWAEEFKKLNPGVKIDISAGGAGKGITDVLSGTADIGMVSRDINAEETKKGAYPIAVTKDAVLPTISSANPNLNELLKKGMKRQGFIDLWVTGKSKTWGQAAGIKSNAPIHVYTRSDAAGASETWAKYLGKKQEDLLGVGVFGDPGLATAVKKDPVGIGYNNIAYVYDSKTKQSTNGVKVIPIDINNNGMIDTDENFYDNVDQVIDAISKGKYPSPPARDLYFVTKGKPSNPALIEFIKYAITEGQKFVHESGYINLSSEKLQSELSKLK
ncbi:MAG TPA: substrate-binding domain-containing protein [Bacteroidia bacterium]|nr:substrate-binding domain-containing protein [Bacteroidia bacterium]